MGDAFKSIHPFQSTFSAALTGTGTDSSHGISYEQQEESRRSRRLWDTLDGSLILCSFMAVRIEWELSASELVQAFNHPLLGLVALIGCILVRLAFFRKSLNTRQCDGRSVSDGMAKLCQAKRITSLPVSPSRLSSIPLATIPFEQNQRCTVTDSY